MSVEVLTTINIVQISTTIVCIHLLLIQLVKGWKIAVVLAMITISFLFFAQCTRYLAHFPFIMQSHAFLKGAREKGVIENNRLEQMAIFSDDVDAEYLAWVLNRGMLFYSLGFRVFYFTIPSTFVF
jgi:hypothetical protein